MSKLINKKDAKVLVIGDVMLDEYVFGRVDRISQEAPIPIVWANKDNLSLGGAGNVINNLIALGARVTIVGLIGNDVNGNKVIDLLNRSNVNIKGLMRSDERITTTKTRIISSNQQLLRVDRESNDDMSRAQTHLALAFVESVKDDFDAVILSDYGKGVLGTYFLSELVATLGEKFIAVDPIGYDYSKYKGVDVITPNKKEAAWASSVQIVDNKTLELAGRRILINTGPTNLLITCGKEGMVLFRDQTKPFYISTEEQEVFDVSGAGDTVVSVLTLAAISGFSIEEAAALANVAAGIVVGQVGTATVSMEELEEKYNDK